MIDLGSDMRPPGPLFQRPLYTKSMLFKHFENKFDPFPWTINSMQTTIKIDKKLLGRTHTHKRQKTKELRCYILVNLLRRTNNILIRALKPL